MGNQDAMPAIRRPPSGRGGRRWAKMDIPPQPRPLYTIRPPPREAGEKEEPETIIVPGVLELNSQASPKEK